MRPVLIGTALSGNEDLDVDIRDLQWLAGPGAGYLYSSTDRNGGLSVFAIQPNGKLEFVESESYATFGIAAHFGAIGVSAVTGGDVVHVGNTGDGGVFGYAIGSDGMPGKAETIPLPGGPADPAGSISVSTPGGAEFLVTADGTSGRLQSWKADGSGGLKQAGTVAADVAGTGPVILSHAATAGSAYILMADSALQGVSSYRLDPDTGAMSRVATSSAKDGLALNTPTSMSVVSAFGETWVFVGAAHSNSLSVLHLAADGSLTATDHVIDTRETRFAEVQVVAAFETNGQVFVVAGGSDDGLSVFSLLPAGVLVHRMTLPHETGAGLDNISDIEVVLEGDRALIYVTSATTPGIAAYSLSLANLGDTLAGTGKDDILSETGSSGIRLTGGKGDDILHADAGKTDLNGGDGSDIFLLQPTATKYHIEDFETGVDRLDLSLFPMLRSPAQLDLSSRPKGLRIEWADTVIVVDSSSGGSLTAEDIWPTGFDGADRVPLVPATEPPPISGTILKGTKGRDRLRGDEGNHVITAKGGKDRIWDPAGDNLLDGGRGSDKIEGGSGKDTVLGGKGGDAITGQGGDDVLKGDGGKDTISGDDGRDRILGGRGNDSMTGGDGNDSIKGGNGRDTAFGGTGNDTVSGGSGVDSVFGDQGDDMILGGEGDDTADGGLGADTVAGAGGNDTLHGGDGSDQLRGGTGSDWLYGDSGEDTLAGFGGGDVFVFAEAHGRDVIADFEPGIDLIRIEIAGLTFSDLEMREKGGFAFVTTTGGDISLTGVHTVELSDADFVFA